MRPPQEILGGVGSPAPSYNPGMQKAEGNKETQVSEALKPFEEECELCGTDMFGLHCKLICPNCGYRRDCSDP